MHQPFYCIIEEQNFSHWIRLLLYSVFSCSICCPLYCSQLFQYCCQSYSKFLSLFVLVLFSTFFPYKILNILSQYLFSMILKLIVLKNCLSFFSHLFNLFSIYLSLSKCAHNCCSIFLYCQCILISLFSIVISKFLCLCCQLFNNVNNFLLFVINLFF